MIESNFYVYLLALSGFDAGADSLLRIKLRGLSPHANYTDRAAAAGRRS